MDYLKWMLIFCILCKQVNTGNCKTTDLPAPANLAVVNEGYQGDDYDYDDVNDANISEDVDISPSIEINEATMHSPYFEENELELYVKPDEDLLINCDVRNFQLKNVVMWYKGNILIASGQYPINNRAEAMKNNSLLIKNVQDADAGDYYCQVLPEKIRMHAAIKLLGRLVIFCDGRDVTDKSITFKQGESHTFECNAYGAGNPQIKWSLNGQRVINNLIKVDGSKMFMENIDAEHSGIYQCLGDDNTHDPPHGMVTINVQYSPKITTLREHVNTEEGYRSQLYCDYKADPIAVTHWLKNGRILRFSHKYSVKNTLYQGMNRTILTVKNVGTTDLGEYQCQAVNTIGTNAEKVFLIYEPENPQLEDMKVDGNKVTLFWLVRSVQPLSEAVLDYKMNGAYTWSTVSVIQTKRNTEHSGIWKLTHEMELVPGNWHARVKAKNIIGWSKFSLPHEFYIQDPEGGDNNILDNTIPPQDMIMAEGIGIGKPMDNASKCLTMAPVVFSPFLLHAIIQTLWHL